MGQHFKQHARQRVIGGALFEFDQDWSIESTVKRENINPVLPREAGGGNWQFTFDYLLMFKLHIPPVNEKPLQSLFVWDSGAEFFQQGVLRRECCLIDANVRRHPRVGRSRSALTTSANFCLVHESSDAKNCERLPRSPLLVRYQLRNVRCRVFISFVFDHTPMRPSQSYAFKCLTIGNRMLVFSAKMLLSGGRQGRQRICSRSGAKAARTP